MPSTQKVTDFPLADFTVFFEIEMVWTELEFVSKTPLLI